MKILSPGQIQCWPGFSFNSEQLLRESGKKFYDDREEDHPEI
jgi:hypothetical protein